MRLFLLLVLATSAVPAVAQSQIRLNQTGFYPGQPKVAGVVAAEPGSFYVRPAGGGEAVYEGELSAARSWAPSGETVRQADFSALSEVGEYVLEVPGLGASYPFSIAERVHENVARAALKGYYFQRASTALASEYAGPWARPAGHPDTEVIVHPSAASEGRPAGSTISAPKGWYDAGDYNKYVVNSGISVGTLLQLYEHFPDYFTAFGLDIPESGNGIPDLLDEVLWNVRWMLDMQDPADGGVYHKLTHANFSGAVMPHEASAPRYVVQKGTAATLDFAAVMAQASRIFDDFEGELPGLADSLLAASLNAWDWARTNPDVAYDQSVLNAAFDPDIQTGAYGDSDFADEFDWAAMELYVTTQADSFLVATQPTNPIQMGIPWWGGVRELGYYSLLEHREAVAADIDTTALKARLLSAADAFVARRATSAYGVVMSSGDFYWGSNAVAGNQGIQLLQAYRLTGDTEYLETAIAALDYLLGRNATGYSFVTGHGSRTPMEPHHRPSEADDVAEPVPGLLVGGPNPGQEDGCSYPSDEPARSYLDDWCSYASNEITINWNAPLAYLAGAVEALLSSTGLPTSGEPSHGALPKRLPTVSYPNPFRTSATIRFSLPHSASVSVRVYDLLGRAVSVLTDGEALRPGTHELAFEARSLPSGMYIYRVETAGGLAFGSMTLVRAE
jgi:endoglucanase